jgi:NDP-sugar pyrophosphorylase family protein
MAPVAGIPFLHYLLSWLSRQGVRDVVLCVGYKRSQIQKFVGRGKKWNLRVRYSVEKELLGTGGAVKKAKNLIAGGRFIVVNGDTFLDTSLIELAKLHQQRKALVTVAVVKVPKKGRYGSVHLDERGRIVSFAEKLAESAPETTANRYAVNGGVYVFEKKLLMLIRPRKRVSLETDCFPRLSKNKRVYGVVKDTYFLDIGVPDDYRRAQIELPRRVSSSYPR